MPPSTALAPVIEFPSAESTPHYDGLNTEVLAIASSEAYTATAERLKVITNFRRRVQDFFKPLKDKAHAAHKALCDAEKKALQPAEADELSIKRALVAYSNEQERLRQLEARRLQEAQRVADETRRLEEAAALEREAHATGDVAMQEQAEQILETPAPVMSVQPTTPAAPKVEGLSYRTTYRGEVFNPDALFTAAMSDPQMRAYIKIEPNQKAIDAVASSLREKLAIPGVRLVTDKTPVTRTR